MTLLGQIPPEEKIFYWTETNDNGVQVCQLFLNAGAESVPNILAATYVRQPSGLYAATAYITYRTFRDVDFPVKTADGVRVVIEWHIARSLIKFAAALTSI